MALKNNVVPRVFLRLRERGNSAAWAAEMLPG